MERLKGPDLVLLQSQMSGFTSSSHVRYLSEALQTTRASNNPGEALALLRAMWGTAYAKTAEEKRSLNDVGAWLERRLREDLGVDAGRIALELAWGRRIARIAEARAKEERSGANEHSDSRQKGSWDRPGGECVFGKDLESLLRRRAERLALRQSGGAPSRAASGTSRDTAQDIARRRLDELVVGFRGAQNARQVFEGMMALAAEEGLHDAVRQALGKLQAKDAKFWKGWLKDKAKPDERAFAQRFGMAIAGSGTAS